MSQQMSLLVFFKVWMDQEGFMFFFFFKKKGAYSQVKQSKIKSSELKDSITIIDCFLVRFFYKIQDFSMFLLLISNKCPFKDYIAN
jgi:hypothetical protein